MSFRAWPTTGSKASQPVMCQPVQWRQSETCQPYNVMDVHEVTAAVESLYLDELKPYGRILRKRLAERASQVGLANMDVDIKRLKGVCDTCPWIYVQAEEGGDWSALLCGRSLNFVDVYSPQDFYPQKLWQAAEAYFESLDDAHMVLPGGRYSCAQALVSRGLDFLNGRTLGQVCHIVQLAISQKKLLGYLNGAVVPYKRSQSMIKERCAEKQRPCTNTARNTSSDLANWEKVKEGLKEILASCGSSTIPLSNVKRLFRSRYHTELSETALGHSKLSELLQDIRLKDVCHVRLQGHGYVVGPANQCKANQQYQPLPQQPLMQVPVAPAPKCHPHLPHVHSAPHAHLAHPGHGHPHAHAHAHHAQHAHHAHHMTHPSHGAPAVGTQPISAAAAGAAVVTAAVAAACGRSEFPAMQFDANDRPSLRDRARFVQPLSMEDVETTEARSARKSRWEPASCQLGLADEMNLPGVVPSTPQVPLMPPTPDTPGFPKWPMLTPNRMDGMGLSVQNTFINYNLPPPTPCQPGGRSHSVPRNTRLTEDSPNKTSESTAQHPANRLMSKAAAAADVKGLQGYPQSYASGSQSAGSQWVVRLADLL